MLTVFLSQGDGPRSVMLGGYLLLIAGAALRFRSGLVLFVTGLDSFWRRPEFAGGLKDWIFFVLTLLLLGFIQHLLLRRLRSAMTRER